MKNKELKDNLQFEDASMRVVFNHFSFCEMVKHIMVKYGNATYKTANEKLQKSLLMEVPKTFNDVYLLTHELDFHWAMLIVHGNMYWTKGIPSDYNAFEDEYLTWQDEIRRKYNLKESYVFYEKTKKDDGVAMNKKILEIIELNFDETQRKLVIAELSSIKLSHVMANSQYNLDNTWLAILKLANGSLDDVIEFTKSAKTDFRDVIMWAMQEK